MADLDALRVERTRLEQVIADAQKQLHAVNVSIAEAQGDTSSLNARWDRALAAGDHATAHACCLERWAEYVSAGTVKIEEIPLPDVDRAKVAAMLPRCGNVFPFSCFGVPPKCDQPLGHQGLHRRAAGESWVGPGLDEVNGRLA